MVDERLHNIQQAARTRVAEARDQKREASVADHTFANTARKIGDTGVIAATSLMDNSSLRSFNRSTIEKLTKLRRAMNTNIGRDS